MKSLIESLYKEKVLSFEKTRKFKDMEDRLSILENDIIKSCPDCKTKLNDYFNTMYTISNLNGLSDFTQGFRMGAKFMLEVLTADEKDTKK